LPDITIPYNKPIDKTGMIRFLATNKIRIGINYILDTWKPVPLTFHSGRNDDEEVFTDEEEQTLEAISEGEDDTLPNDFLDQETGGEEDGEEGEDVFEMTGEDAPI
jgi:hypothetical protein